jgi:hypothetical protein
MTARPADLHLFTADEIQQQISSGWYSAELLLQHAVQRLRQMETQYDALYDASFDCGACAILESGRIPGFTKRRLIALMDTLVTLPESSTYKK